ncbi:MAG: hypothetical protein NTZ73_02580 [Candidatus Diapherotrites archaeon]|nr:hypothetical protein [Candidatus Diapherotrites archaeon]
MGLLQKLFGGNSGPVRTTPELLRGMIEKDFKLREKELENFVAKKMAEIKHLNGKSVKLLVDIQKKEIGEERGGARFNKAAVTAKKQVERQLMQLLEKLGPKERGKTLSDARAYSGEGFALMINEINAFRKNIVYTSVFIKEEMKELGNILQEMLDSFHEMNQKFGECKSVFEFEKFCAMVEKIGEERKIIKEKEEEKKALKKKMEEQNEALKNQETRIEVSLNSQGMRELKVIEGEKNELLAKKQDLRSEVSSLINSIDRPLQRFKSLVGSGRWRIPKEEEEIMDAFIVNPLLAMKKDPKAEKFKKVLKEIKKAIEGGEIVLKDKEKEKRLAALEELLAFDFFENVFWKINEAQKRQIEIEKEIEKNPAQKAVENEKERLKEIEKEINGIRERISGIEKEIEKTNQGISQQLKALEEFGSTAMKRQVILVE